MLPQFPTYPLPIVGEPPLNNRFLVVFFHAVPAILRRTGAPNPLDMLFRSVSGIGSSVELDAIPAGGQNLYTAQVPKRIKHDNLVLERGMVTPSLLSVEFELAMSQFRVKPLNVLVILLNMENLPVSAWLFLQALPVRWHLSNLDADNESVMIESLELTYQLRLSLLNSLAGNFVAT